MRTPSWYRRARDRASGPHAPCSGLFAHARAVGLAVAVVLASVGCGANEQVVYVDPVPPGGYTPITRSADPRVHDDGRHEPAAEVQIGPAAAEAPTSADGDGSSYTPIARSGGPLVHAGAASHAVAPPVAIAGEPAPASAAAHDAASSASSHGSAVTSNGHGSASPAGSSAAVDLAHAQGAAPTGSQAATASAGTHGAPASAAAPAPAGAAGHAAAASGLAPAIGHAAAASEPKPGAAIAARPAVSPTPAARLALGPALGASASASPLGDVLTMEEEKEQGQASIVGKIESIAGPLLKIQTPAGSQGVRLAEQARVEREAMGSVSDLKPGQFVGIVHLPSGPADAVRLYATNPSMPRPGIAPLVGSRSGQVTTFGSIVKLEFGGLVLNTGSQTTMVTLPSGVPILRPSSQGSSDLAVGTQVVASGPIDSDGSLVATAVRVTGESRPVAQAAPPGRSTP